MLGIEKHKVGSQRTRHLNNGGMGRCQPETVDRIVLTEMVGHNATLGSKDDESAEHGV